MSVIRTSTFGGRVKIWFSGQEFGDCQTNYTGELLHQSVSRINEARLSLGARYLVLPKIGHGTNLVQVSRPNWSEFCILDENCPVLKTTTEADGLMTTCPGVALAIAPADCPIGLVYHRESNSLSLLHLGLKPLLAEPNIIEQAIAQAPAPARELEFAFGFGINGCCNGYTEGHEYLEQIKKICPCAVRGYVAKGVRKGQPAVQMMSLIWCLAEHHFGAISTKVIEKGKSCTACWEGKESIKCFSNVYADRDPVESLKRNLFAVVF